MPNINLISVLLTANFLQSISTVISAAEQVPADRHVAKVKRGTLYVSRPPESIKQRNQWLLNSCQKLKQLFRRKKIAVQKLDNAIQKIKSDKKNSAIETFVQIKTFELIKLELNESESMVFQSIHWLNTTLQGNVKGKMNLNYYD